MPPQFPFNPNQLLRLNARCPICGNVYDLQKLRIIGEREGQVLAYIDCSSCSTALLSILTMSPNGMTAHGLVTDLSADEVVDSEGWKPVNADDVLNIHEFLDRDKPGIIRLRS